MSARHNLILSDLRFHCAICGIHLSVAGDHAGGLTECPQCRRNVPVPAFFPRLHDGAEWMPALPPRVLSLDVKFLCHACDSKLAVDARWEGGMVACPVCSAQTRVPEWSRATRPEATQLSSAEIEFLSSPGDFSATPVSAA